MSKRDDLISLRQMLDHAREALSFAASRNRGDLDTDRLFFLATCRLLEIIGEAANRVALDTQDLYPAIAWPQIVGMRNRITHGYDEVDRDIMWQVLIADLPELIAQLTPIVAQLP